MEFFVHRQGNRKNNRRATNELLETVVVTTPIKTTVIEDGFPRIEITLTKVLVSNKYDLYLRVVDSSLQHNRLKSFWLIRRLLSI